MDLGPIYLAPTAQEAMRQLDEFAAKWDTIIIQETNADINVFMCFNVMHAV